MSSRQEQKAKAKAEREAAEAAAQKAAMNKGRLQLALGGLVAIAAIAVFVLILSGGGDGGGDAKTPTNAGVNLPTQQITNLSEAAKAAGCTVTKSPIEGREHSTDPKKWIYKTNPPTSGTHNPTWSEDGLYEAGNTPEIGFTVHTLEHGRIDIQYKPGTSKAVIDQLEAIGSEKLQFGKEGYHVLVFENNTDMKPAIAATAWGQTLACDAMNPKVADAMRAFRTDFTDKGPELIP